MSYKPSQIKQIYHNLQFSLAKKWISLFHPIQIGITGSQGKTNTTKVIFELLKTQGSTVVTDTNLDTNFNVPMTALRVRPWTKFVVWELGIDHIGEMDKYLEIARPDISIITGISPVHTDSAHLGSLTNLIAEKVKIIKSLKSSGSAILNHEDQSVRAMSTQTKASILWYGTDKGCNAYYDQAAVKVTTEGTYGHFISEGESFDIHTHLIGEYHLKNLLAGYLVMKIVLGKKNISVEFKRALSNIKPLKGRMSIENGPLGALLLNDSLRANPESTNVGIKTLYDIEYKNGSKIAVIGEMSELADPIFEHTQTASVIKQYPPDFVVLIGNYRKYTYLKMLEMGFDKNKISYVKDVFEAAEILKNLLKPGDLWYLKGSLLRNYKRIVDILSGKKACCEAEFCPYSHCGYKD